MNTDEILRSLSEKKPEFENKFGLKRIGIFGSYSTGEYDQDSDVDIVVELEKPDMFSLVGIKQAIEEQLNIDVDIVRYRKRMNRFLKKRIDRDARYV